MTSLAALPDAKNISIIQRWLTPQSTDWDTRFREKTIRLLIPALFFLSGSSLLASVIFFGAAWQIISYPTVELGALVLLCLAAYFVQGNQITAASYTLVGFSIFCSFLLTAVDTSPTSPFSASYIVSLLMVSLIAPRSGIILFTSLSAVLIAVVLVVSATPTAPQQISNNVITLAAMAVLLYLLRTEFDNRLTGLGLSLTQAEQARQEAERANRAKSQFLANMSHELRTPLNAIIGYTEIMLGGMAGTFTTKQDELHRYVYQNGERLLALINDILDLSRIEAGALTLNAMPYSPRKLVTDLVNTMQSLAETKNITLTVTFGENIPEAIICDVGKTQQVLTNLIGNALKFTAAGGVELIVSAVDTDHWQVAVRDSGIGMPDDAVSYIFEAFRQVDNGDTRKYQGTGLGLAITRKLIDRLGGTISVQSTQNVGSTFTITLPRIISQT